MTVFAWLIVPAGILALVPFPFGGLVRLRLLIGWLGTLTYIIEGLVLSWVLGNGIGTEGSKLAFVVWTLAPITVLYAGFRLARLQRRIARLHLEELRGAPTGV